LLQKSAEELGAAERRSARRALDVPEANRGADRSVTRAIHTSGAGIPRASRSATPLNHERAEQELRSLFAGQQVTAFCPTVFADG
jgi:hypothetical protein